MKMIVVVALALVAVAMAAPVAELKIPQIVRSEFEQEPAGGYHYGFETEDGISRSENGELKEVADEDGKPKAVVTVRGSYTYTDKEGNTETVNYYADETGFHAEGPSIPKGPATRR